MIKYKKFISEPYLGWIYKGEQVNIPLNIGRKCLNLNGAVNVEAQDVIVIKCSEIDANATISLFKRIETYYPKVPFIYIFTDNSKYYYRKKIKEFLKNSKIPLYNLSLYSANLNIIKRLWKFKNTCLFFKNSISDCKDKLKILLILNFHLFSDKMIRALAYS